MPPNHNYFDHVPDHILQHILGSVEFKTRKNVVPCVCRRFLELVDWRDIHLDFSHHDSVDGVRRLKLELLATGYGTQLKEENLNHLGQLTLLEELELRFRKDHTYSRYVCYPPDFSRPDDPYHWRYVGRFPEALCNLTRLRTLLIDGTGDYESTLGFGDLPDSLSRLLRLESLELLACCVTAIPCRALGNLPRLHTLQVGEKFCRGDKLATCRLHQGLGTMTALTRLHLSDIVLDGDLPPCIGKLGLMSELDLDSCDLAALPAEIGSLKGLHALWLTNNPRLTCLPDSIGNLSALKTLCVSGTKLAVLPESIGQLRALQWLPLSRTDLVCLPESISGLVSLRTLDLAQAKQLLDIPSTLGCLTALKRLTLASLPWDISKLTALQSLDLSYNSQLAA
ncbi:hypothetical protein WJX72_006580 [[Myrmecia] bisecta]|uniref:Disease resistance R13L4/SHOC-2-like LRR domain-containing protein n=1 Tax=[Myrmecia] bisecta TaxID=41462 RepID=A0AAW1PK12_9CHLO